MLRDLFITEHFSPHTVLDLNVFCKRKVRHSPVSCLPEHSDFSICFSLTQTTVPYSLIMILFSAGSVCDRSFHLDQA